MTVFQVTRGLQSARLKAVLSVDSLQGDLACLCANITFLARAKLQVVWNENEGISVLKKVPSVLAREHPRIPVSLKPLSVPEYNCTPITSVGV